jgi:antibiotic biosynthesis monooxygenase (ABM) superfamily enzyme
MEPAPPRWKQTVAIWLGFFPLSLLSNFFLAPFLAPAPVTVRVLVLTGLQTPVMTYLVLPRITAALSWWLLPSTRPPSTASRGAAPSPLSAARVPA